MPGERCYLFFASRFARVAMRTLGASEVAELLHEFGQRTAFRGGNPYCARAYTRAAETFSLLRSLLKTLLRRIACGKFQASVMRLQILSPSFTERVDILRSMRCAWKFRQVLLSCLPCRA